MRLGDLRTQWLNCEIAFAMLQVTPVEKPRWTRKLACVEMPSQNQSLSSFPITASIVPSGSLFSSA